MVHGRVSKKPLAWADRLGGLIDAGSVIREWWTSSSTGKADAPTAYLYVDDGEAKSILCITVQRIDRPKEMPLPKGGGRTPGVGNQIGGGA